MKDAAKPVALILVTSDPTFSPRPAEAIRIAAGLQAWGRIEVALYLGDLAVMALAGNPEHLVDEDQIRQCLPLLQPPRATVYAMDSAAVLPDAEEWGTSAFRISEASLATLAAESSWVLRF